MINRSYIKTVLLDTLIEIPKPFVFSNKIFIPGSALTTDNIPYGVYYLKISDGIVILSKIRK